ncbi:MAG: hypothetical protein ACKVHE_07885 [Planctomycetales bacterium]|jgi:hypothetical protein
MKTLLLACILFPAQVLLLNSSTVAQPMVYTTTPLQANSDRFFESTNMNWSLRGPNFFATFGGPNIGIPKFGGYNPNAGISSGWAFNSGKFSGNFGFNFSQGFSRTSTTTAPSLMTTNGQTGQFFSGVRRPFVYSLVPVVPPGGAFFSAPSPPFHQQCRQPTSIAARVLRGELVLPRSNANSQNDSADGVSQSSAVSSDPHAARTNAAYAWFKDNSHTKAATVKYQSTGGVTAQAAFKKPAGQPNENAAALVAKRIVPSKPQTSETPPDLNSNSDRIAKVYFQRGLDAEADKNVAKAAFLFRMAADRASGTLRERIEKHLQSLPPQ